jgi:hypothetical protein
MSLILVCSYSSPPKATKGLLLPLLAAKLPDLAPPPADFERTEYLLPKDWHDFACEAPQLLSTAEHRLILRPIYSRNLCLPTKFKFDLMWSQLES